MRLLRCIVPFTFLVCSWACGDNQEDGDDEPYDTFQLCFDDHNKVEDFDVETSIKICCISHPIGGAGANIVCGENAAACETFVAANLADADASAAEITSACAGYIIDRDQ